jgi:hypothetical protein
MVRQLPSVLLHRMISTIGRADAGDLLTMASPQQVREVLDLELWRGDRLDLTEAVDWLYFLTTLPDQVRVRDIKALDVELIGLVLRRNLRIYLADEEEIIPDEPEGTLYKTPDGWFVLEVLADDRTTVERLIEVVEKLYEDDPDETRRLLQNLMWELPNELEEYAYRWRNGRLQDMGFADPHDALLIYAYLSPSAVSAAERSADRPLAADPEPIPSTAELQLITPELASFLTRVLRTIDQPAERRRITLALLTVSNRALAADRVILSDEEAARESIEALHYRLSVGLEHLSQGDMKQAQQILQNVALIRIARVGHSLALDLRRRIAEPVRCRRLGRVAGDISLLDPTERERVASILLPRPMFLDEATGEQRPFRDLREVERAQDWIDDALATADLVEALDKPSPLPLGVTAGDLFRTAVVNRLLEREGPLSQAALTELIERHVEDGRLRPEVRELAQSSTPPELQRRAMVERWLDRLEEAVAPLEPQSVDLRFVDGLWLEREGA